VKKKRVLKKLKLALLFVVVLFAASLVIRIYNSHRFHLEKQTRFMMDTFVTIYAVGPQKLTSRAIDLALDRMQEIDTKFNILNPRSPIYAFNHKGVPISDQEILNVVRVALEVGHESDGAFDITVAPLVELWGFYGDSPQLPKEKGITDCRNNVNYEYLTITDGKLEKSNEEVRIDLGGIAKGYCVSQAVNVLKEEGVTSALIDAGGDVYALGKKGRKLWNVGIRHPREEGLLGYVEVEELAVLGSGDYERFFVEDGRRYHHILNPRTGYPAEDLSGITLVHSDPVVADAWNTALFVLGPEKGLEIVERTSGMEAIMVTTSGDILYSSGFRDRLKRIAKVE
jgi:thiamine biosynthesis lipoprotein